MLVIYFSKIRVYQERTLVMIKKKAHPMPKKEYNKSTLKLKEIELHNCAI